MKISLLQQMYKDVLAGTPLPKESYYYTSFLNLCVGQSQERDELRDLPSTDDSARSHQDAVIPTADDVSHNLANMNFSFYPREVMLLQLTLIEMLVAKAESQEIGFSARQKYCEILLLLLKETQVDSKLVRFCNLWEDFCKRRNIQGILLKYCFFLYICRFVFLVAMISCYLIWLQKV